MRAMVVAGAALLLAGCGGAPKPAGPVMAKAGQWRSVQTMVSVTGIPAGTPTPAPPPPQTSLKCLAGGKMPDAIWSEGGPPPANVKVDGNHFAAEIPPLTSLDEPTNQMMTESSRIEGTFDETHYDVTVRMTLDMGPQAPNVVSTMRVTGQYLGPCPAATTDDNAAMAAPDDAGAALDDSQVMNAQ